jgi:hypothetical protein
MMQKTVGQMNWQSRRAKDWVVGVHLMKSNILRTAVFLGTTMLLAGCFESTPATPPTDAEFHMACVKLFVQSNSKSSTTLGSSDIVPVCKCLAEQIRKSKDPEFQIRISRAFVDSGGDDKIATEMTKSYMNTFPVGSAEYLIEKSKIDELEHNAKNCNMH